MTKYMLRLTRIRVPSTDEMVDAFTGSQYQSTVGTCADTDKTNGKVKPAKPSI